MAVFKIMRIYEVPDHNQIQVTNRMMEALRFSHPESAPA